MNGLSLPRAVMAKIEYRLPVSRDFGPSEDRPIVPTGSPKGSMHCMMISERVNSELEPGTIKFISSYMQCQAIQNFGKF